jgi:hypothetical protein
MSHGQLSGSVRRLAGALALDLRAARADGDEREVERIRAKALRAGGETLVAFVEEAAGGAHHRADAGPSTS